MTTRALGSAEETELSRAERDIRARLGDRPFDFRAMAAISNIYRAASAVRNHMEQRVLAGHGLSWSAFTVMWVLWIWGEQETGRVAAETGTTKGTLTGVLKTLESRGLVVRSSHPGDGRRVLVRLSPEGEAVIEEVFPRFNAEETFAASALGPCDQDRLAGLLRRVSARIDSARSDSARSDSSRIDSSRIDSSRSGSARSDSSGPPARR
ncbi:MAG: MarR family winged helix-turn-helix transcriptional regulator [Actinomycetota bacterium]|nr:MarR family winged helix-turn-helix transcriptional regulator [Actinomycetota bacterium]